MKKLKKTQLAWIICTSDDPKGGKLFSNVLYVSMHFLDSHCKTSNARMLISSGSLTLLCLMLTWQGTYCGNCAWEWSHMKRKAFATICHVLILEFIHSLPNIASSRADLHCEWIIWMWYACDPSAHQTLSNVPRGSSLKATWVLGYGLAWWCATQDALIFQQFPSAFDHSVCRLATFSCEFH